LRDYAGGAKRCSCGRAEQAKEINVQHHIVPDIVRDQVLITLSPDVSVRQAVAVMAEHKIGALLIAVDEKLVGIFTERDVVMRVISKDLDPDTTLVKEAMTASPDTVGPNDVALDALERMREGGYRHLPVVEGRIVGMVSIRDLFNAVKKELEQDLKHRDQLMFDTGYGGG
jgi:CBS domain-containing protein